MFKNKVALITGSSSGIGKEIAIQMAKEGITVYLNYSKDDKKANEVKDLIERNQGKVFIIKADVSNEKDVKEMMAFIKSNSGRLDYLINNAGINIVNPFENYEVKDWEEIINVNLTGKFLCTKYATPLLKLSSDPRIINIASRFGTKPDEEIPAYCCAESGVIMLTKVSCLALSKYGIKVNTISPSLTKTPLTEKICSKEEFEEYAKKNPSKRVGLPEDISNAILFLISDKANFINGENINVSGGILLK
jgi:NAD(P)-dependent dehydrogenase (short-subunit alcohol dehydrogenase family)